MKANTTPIGNRLKLFALLPALLFVFIAPPASAVDIVGDTVTSDLTVEGDDLILNGGSTTESFELQFKDLATNELHFWQSEGADWIWSYGSTPTYAMTLGLDHVLSLYDYAASPSATIVFDPGEPGANPVIPPTIMIGEDLVLTSASVLPALSGHFLPATHNSSLLLTANLGGSGNPIPAEGSGNRLMWWPERSAFRAGSAWGSNWDEPNVGYSSVAFSNGKASGAESFAGAGASATGFGAFAFGSNAKANGTYSVALQGGEANNAYTLAFGTFARAEKIYGIALGNHSTANASWSMAINGATANASRSVALGRNNIGFGSSSSSDPLNTSLEVGLYTSGDTEPKNGLTIFHGGDILIGTHIDETDAPIKVLADGTVDINRIPPKGGISMGEFD